MNYTTKQATAKYPFGKKLSLLLFLDYLNAIASLFYLLKHFIKLIDSVLGHFGYIFEGEGDSELAVFFDTELTEGQQLDPLDAGIFFPECEDLSDAFVRIVKSRDDDVADPSFFGDALEVIEKSLGMLKRAARIFEVILGIGILIVEQYEVGTLEQFFDAIVEEAAAGIECGMDIGQLLKPLKECSDEIRLCKRLAAGNRNTAILTVIRAVSEDSIRDLADADLISAVEAPRIGIMAARTAKRTALHEHDRADAGTVHRSKALERVDSASNLCITLFHGMFSR